MPEGDQDDPGDDPRKRAAAQRAQPIPHNTSTATAPVSFAARQINQGYRPMRRGKL